MPYYIKRKPKKGGGGDGDGGGQRKPTTPRRPSLSRAVQRLDKVFSLYIRLRDSRAYGFRAFRCISCGRIKSFEYADCGHYYSRRNMATRFDEDNCHAECSYCNRFSADHLIAYRLNLVRKIGEQRFALLGVKSKAVRKWSVWELEELTKHYAALVKGLEAEAARGGNGGNNKQSV